MGFPHRSRLQPSIQPRGIEIRNNQVLSLDSYFICSQPPLFPEKLSVSVSLAAPFVINVFSFS